MMIYYFFIKQSREFGNSIYFTKWNCVKNKSTKLIVLPIMMSQKEIIIKSACFEASMETYVIVSVNILSYI